MRNLGRVVCALALPSALLALTLLLFANQRAAWATTLPSRAREVSLPPPIPPTHLAAQEVLTYQPPAVLIDKSVLMASQALTWTYLSVAVVYTVETAPRPTGSWTVFYSGPYPTAPLPAAANTWYRVRAGMGAEESDWSPPQWKPDPIDQDFLRTYGTTIRRGPTGEIGDVVVLRGVNLGNYLLIEPWLNGWISGTITAVNESDYYTLRTVLEDRFGAAGAMTLLQTYRDSYLAGVDFDFLMRMGVSLIRLPIYYRDLQDDEGNLIPEGFKDIDRVIEASADRGMVVLLDLHGAPGAQSVDCWTGRCNFNKLFQGSEAEQNLFQTQTITLWMAIADRYKDNTTVMGYDLLNEPIGALAADSLPSLDRLRSFWDFYDRLYDAVRAKDSRHIVVMEAIWDLNTLPHPSQYGWENVVYQLHTYCSWCEDQNPSYADRLKAHQEFVDGKVAMVRNYQDGCQYQVPILIGEFNAYDNQDTWSYYLEHFNDQGWSWTLWTYKMAIPNSAWGLLTDHAYDVAALPKFGTDSYDTLLDKLSQQFSTTTRYVPNESLVSTVEHYVNEPYALPALNRFQAEYYDDSSGVAAYASPVGHIGSLDTGDWVRYNAIEFTPDLNTFVANLAVDKTNAGRQILIRLDQVTGTVIGTLTVAGTGGWWTFVDQHASISSTTGTHAVYLTFAGGGGVANIDWFTFRGSAGPYISSGRNTVQAECCNDGRGLVRDIKYIGSLDTGDWVRYNAIEFTPDRNILVANLAVGNTDAGRQIEIRLDQVTGTVIGTLTVAGTGGWWTFVEQGVVISPTTGTHDVYLTFAGSGGVANIDWFAFKMPTYLPHILKTYRP
jgi:aryl-phospho-beta-D-glucosidase BglC (GH1 family)